MYSLICRYLAREASEEEKRRLDDWLDLAPENRERFYEYKALWKGAQAPEPDSVPEFQRLWKRLRLRLHLEEPRRQGRRVLEKVKQIPVPTVPPVPKIPTVLLRSFVIVAASVIVLILLVTFIKRQITDPVYVVTKVGERRTVELPDGSRVTLDGNTRLVFSRGFTDYVRMVNLLGHAFFNVKDNHRPFLLQTDESIMLTEKAQFDALARQDETKVLVATGVAQLHPREPNGQPGIKIKPGELVTVNSKGNLSKPQNTDITEYVAWLTDTIQFENAPLATVVAKLSRIYAVDVRLADPQLETLRLSGKFQSKDLQDVIASVCQELDLSYRSDGSTYILSARQPGAVTVRK